jgi:hypothetical protein
MDDSLRPTVDNLWCISLQRLQERFRRSNENGCSLMVRLMQSTGQAASVGKALVPAEAKSRSSSKSQSRRRKVEVTRADWTTLGWPPLFGSGPFEVIARLNGASSAPQTADDAGFTRSHLYANDGDAFKQYELLANDAGRCLLGLPDTIRTELWSNLPSTTRLAQDNCSLWTDAVFELAFSMRAGSPLVAEKRVWNDGVSIALDQLNLFRKHPQCVIFPQLVQVKNPPPWWYSDIASAFRSSVDAIDILVRLRSNASPAEHSRVAERHVTLRQMAAIVNKSKRTAERLRDAGRLPTPAVKGGDGRADEWQWSQVRPILESEYGRQLPTEFPAGP